MYFYNTFRKLIIACSVSISVLFLMAISSTSIAENKMSQEVIDARQESQIWTTYALNPYLHTQDIKVFVRDGKATITGIVNEDINKDLAEQIALGVKGIRTVDNRLMVQENYKPALNPSERSYGQIIDDTTITTTIKSKLIWSRYTDSTEINVDTLFGKVTLRGRANSAEAKTLAENLAKNTKGVISVNNQLLIGSNSFTNKLEAAATEVKYNVNDGWITAKVISTLLYSSNINSSNITVTTDQAVVTLTGTLDSGAERALAIELTKNVQGVKSVQLNNLTSNK
ncbi:MAG: BON domain-containing protein [Gammaproteobacteria bacterium]|nr:BON domain-containing protein [Gammaproteobacteria bacterium]